MANNDDELKRIAALNPNKGVRTVNRAGLSFKGTAGDAQAFNSAARVGPVPQERPRNQPVQQVPKQAASQMGSAGGGGRAPHMGFIGGSNPKPLGSAGGFRGELLTKENAPKGMGWQERMAINQKIAGNHGISLSGMSSRAQEGMSQAGQTGRTDMEQQGLNSRLAASNAAAESLAQNNATREKEIERNKQTLTDRFAQGKERRDATYSETAAQNDHGRTMSLEEYRTQQANEQANDTWNRDAAKETYLGGAPAADVARFRNGITQPKDLQGLPQETKAPYRAGSTVVGRGGTAHIPVTNTATGETEFKEVPQALDPDRVAPPTAAPQEDDEDYQKYLDSLYR